MSDAPAADPTAARPAGSGNTVPCSSCATPIDPAHAYYSATGDMICVRCNATADVQATEGRAASTMAALGYGTLATALVSLIFNPMTLFSMFAVVQGGYAQRSLLRGDWYRKRLGWQFYLVVLCTVAGTIIGAIPYVFILLAIVLSL